MKSGKCPKCGSSNIYRGQTKDALSYVGNWIFIKRRMWQNKGAYLTHYVCEECNYIGSYVSDEMSMQNIRDEWTPLNSQKPKRKNDE